MNPPAPTPPQSRFGHWLRVLRPLVWWLLLVLALYGHRLHQRLLLDTRLMATPWLGNRNVGFETRLTFDDQPFQDGQCVPLGWHKLTLTHPKAEPLVTNLFIGYGLHDLERLDLQRATGTLAVTADPPAAVLLIQGPEFSVSYTNSTGLTTNVPTDRYTIEARYPHWQGSEDVVVEAGRTVSQRFAPRLGSVRIASNQPQTRYRLAAASGVEVESGDLPATVTGLPVGEYRVLADYDGDRREAKVQVAEGQTNETEFTFVYGAVDLETQPAGARVSAGQGRDLGVTPVRLSRLAPGSWEFKLTKEGYLPVTLELEVAANQTNSVSTNLVNAQYASAMDQARRELAATNLVAASVAVEEALRVQPGDAPALALQAEVRLIAARHAAATGDLSGALRLLDALLAALPDQAEAKQLQADLRQQAQTKAEVSQRLEAAAKRERRPEEYFAEWMKTAMNSGLFDQQAVKVKGNLADVQVKLTQVLTNAKPLFKLVAPVEEPEPGLLRLRAMQSMGLKGWRRCDLVAGQTSDTEVTLVFKVFEYCYGDAISIRAWSGDKSEKNMMPIHPDRLEPAKSYVLPRREVGIDIIREKIRAATGQ